jgi:hypothetical protein
MKKAKHLTSALVLSLSLAVSSFGGIIDCPAPQPPPPTAASSAATTGEIWIPGTVPSGTVTESALVEGLNLLKDLLFAF